MVFLVTFAALLILVLIAYIPISIAESRDCSPGQLTGIKVLSIVGIITFGFLWLVALVWAFCLPRKISAKNHNLAKSRMGSKARPHNVRVQNLNYPE